MSRVEMATCGHCGAERPVNAWCGSELCAERVAQAIERERQWMRGVPPKAER